MNEGKAEQQRRDIPLSQQRINPEILENGDQVVWSNTMSSETIEAWVQKVSVVSGSPVDWAWQGGTAVVMTTGDVIEVVAVMLRPDIEEEYNTKWLAAVEEYIPDYSKMFDLENRLEYDSPLRLHIGQALSAEGEALKPWFVIREALKRNQDLDLGTNRPNCKQL
jgi:hypothetical protein